MTRGSLPQRLFPVYVAGLAVVGVVLVVLAIPQVEVAHGLAFVTAGLLAELAPAQLRPDVRTSLLAPVVFTAMLVGGQPLAVVTAAAGAVALLASYRDRRFARAGFNLGDLTLSAAAGGLVLEQLAGVGDVGVITSPRGLAALLLAAALYTVINQGLLGIVLWLTSGEPPASLLRSLRPMSGIQLLHTGLSIVASVLILDVSPVALVLLLVPALVARHGFLGFEEQERAYGQLVRALVKAIEVKDGYTRGHADRVAELTDLLTGALELGYEERRLAHYAAVLHDIGKIAVPISVIHEAGPLSDEQFEAIKRHPVEGAELLADIDFLVPALDIVRYHHERVDGRGYPYGLRGDELPLLARVVTIADAFDAMTSTRSYRRALPVAHALAELRRHAGEQFDPELVEVFAAAVLRAGWTSSDTDADELPALPETHRDRSRLSASGMR